MTNVLIQSCNYPNFVMTIYVPAIANYIHVIATLTQIMHNNLANLTDRSVIVSFPFPVTSHFKLVFPVHVLYLLDYLMHVTLA